MAQRTENGERRTGIKYNGKREPKTRDRDRGTDNGKQKKRNEKMKTIIRQCETESKQRKAMSGKQQQERETNHMATENEQQTTRSAQCKTKSDEIQAGGLGGAAPPALYNFLNEMEMQTCICIQAGGLGPQPYTIF